MKRSISEQLTAWKVRENRRPLLIKGARQIGKSFSIREFGKHSFRNIVELNLEQSRHLKQLFESNDPLTICSHLALQLNQPIIPGETLLFIDEIQESREALLSLRYFYENLPNLHVVAAGSLLDLVLDQNQEIKFPVGRIEYLYMYPLSFVEFLDALGESFILDFISTLSIRTRIPEPTHNKLLQLFNQYVICGGMPAVVSEYINGGNINLHYRKIQADLIHTYKDDFRKYRTRIDYDRLEATFINLANFVGKDIKLSQLCPDFSQATAKNILRLLDQAQVIHSVLRSPVTGIPLGAGASEKKNKYIFLDIGLLNALLGIDQADIQRWNYDLINSGAVAEQIVGQELLAYSNSDFEPQLHYWTRDKYGSSAEIDYVINKGQSIIPVEVKSGATGKLKSIRIFLEEKGLPLGVRISQHQLSLHDKILSVPIYAISKAKELYQEALGESPN